MRRLGLLVAAALLGSGLGQPALAQCNLGNGIKHVVYIQFDNIHFTRDNPNVPSDLEQMPNLLNFLIGNGTFQTNHWTPLISHTAVDILTALTGVYGDRFVYQSVTAFVISTRTARAPARGHSLIGPIRSILPTAIRRTRRRR
jgi:hypothetical protein